MAKRKTHLQPSKTKAKHVKLAIRRGPGEAMPPSKGAPPATAPIQTRQTSGALAPFPLVDRFPLLIGQNLSLSYASSVFRLATSGYRQQYADLLNELLEQDPHLFSVLQKRIFSTATGRVEIVAADLPEDHPDHDRARDLKDFVQSEIARIPDLVQNLAALLWAIYYGVSAAEIYWTRDTDGWHVDRLQFVHTRRLAYPDYQDWSLYVWDQGQVYGWQGFGNAPTNSQMFGLRVADWPGKFIVYAPQLRGDYPTRDGVGRETATWSLLKRVGVRGATAYLERFSKPFMDVVYSTQADGVPREATEEDIAIASQIAGTIGPGSGSYAVHADSVKVDPKSWDGTGTPKLTWPEWVEVCNSEMSKAVLGGTLGTEVGKTGGNRALGEVQQRGEVAIEQYDATTLGETLRRDLVTWIVRLNRPQDLDVLPSVNVHVDADPEPRGLVEVAKILASIGAPVDLDALSDQVGIPLTPNETGQPRRSFMSDVLDPTIVDPELPSEEAKAAEQKKQDAADALAQAKAQQPLMAPNANGSQEPGDDEKAPPPKKPAPTHSAEEPEK